MRLKKNGKRERRCNKIDLKFKERAIRIRFEKDTSGMRKIVFASLEWKWDILANLIRNFRWKERKNNSYFCQSSKLSLTLYIMKDGRIRGFCFTFESIFSDIRSGHGVSYNFSFFLILTLVLLMNLHQCSQKVQNFVNLPKRLTHWKDINILERNRKSSSYAT